MDTLIKKLQLQQHFEGGTFKETWRSGEREGLKVTLDGHNRSACTSCFYAMSKGQTLSWHKLRGDNIHTWHSGGTLQIHILETSNGGLRTEILGNSLEDDNCSFQVVVPRDHWYAAEVIGESDYILWGEIVVPGWELSDYRCATRDDLIHLYPGHEQLIEKFLERSQ